MKQTRMIYKAWWVGLVLSIAGCGFGQSPIITKQGDIHGGHPKLNDLLHKMKNMQAINAADGNRSESKMIAYIGSDSSSQMTRYSGSFPDKFEFDLFFDGVGVVTAKNVFVIQLDGNGKMINRPIIWEWKEKEWRKTKLQLIFTAAPGQIVGRDSTRSKASEEDK